MKLVQFKRRQADVWVNADLVWTVEHAGQPVPGAYETAIRMGSDDDAYVIVGDRCDAVVAALTGQAEPEQAEPMTLTGQGWRIEMTGRDATGHCGFTVSVRALTPTLAAHDVTAAVHCLLSDAAADCAAEFCDRAEQAEAVAS